MFTSAAPLSLSFFTDCAPGYAGSPMSANTAESLVFTCKPPNGVAIFTLSLLPFLCESTWHPAISNAVATPATTHAAIRCVCIRLPLSHCREIRPAPPARQYAPAEPLVPSVQTYSKPLSPRLRMLPLTSTHESRRDAKIVRHSATRTTRRPRRGSLRPRPPHGLRPLHHRAAMGRILAPRASV